MEFLANALQMLPTIASSPLAFVGYVLTLGAWVFAVQRSKRLKILLARIADIPATDRARVVQLEMDAVVPANLTAEQWIRARQHRHFLIAFLALILTASTVVAVSLHEGREQQKHEAKLEEERRSKEAAVRARQEAIEAKRLDLQRRMTEVEEKMAYAESEFRRFVGAAGIVRSPSDKAYAVQHMNAHRAAYLEHEQAKKKLQEQIDALPID